MPLTTAARYTGSVWIKTAQKFILYAPEERSRTND